MKLLFSFLTVLILIMSWRAAQADIHYVDANSTSPSAPYSTWATAAAVIQDAVDMAGAGDQVLVTNGVYKTGGVVADRWALTNRVAVTKALTILSVNGPDVTVIQGYQDPAVTNFDSSVRCAYLTNGTLLAGFTLTNGATRGAGDLIWEQSGGGVCCASDGVVVSNCVIVGNVATNNGGGGIFGTYINCYFANNVALSGGGANGASLIGCTLSNNNGRAYGGGASAGSLTGCRLTGNTAVNGGGAFGCNLNHCLVAGNSAFQGGGVNACDLKNVTVVNNSALFGAGTFQATLTNCISYYNSGLFSPNFSGGAQAFSCTTPMPASGPGNFTNAPLFINLIGGDYHLQSNSTCINAGNNSYVLGQVDLDGNPRIAGGTIDVGAYEFQSPASMISYAWLWQYGLPTDGTADQADADGDHFNNWQEWQAGTDPTNALSLLKMEMPSNGLSGFTVSWDSVAGKIYFLERAANLGVVSPFVTLQTNIAGQAGTTVYLDTNAIGTTPCFYRVGVR